MTPTATAALDPCKLIDAAQWTEFLGGKPQFLPTQGPEKIDDTKGTVTYCSGFASGPTGGVNVVVSIMTFSSPAEAKSVATTEALAAQIQDGKATIQSDSAKGDPAYWAFSKETGAYTVFKGAKVISLVVSGEKPPAAHKARARELALQIAGKV
jgi:hypothetical protein